MIEARKEARLGRAKRWLFASVLVVLLTAFCALLPIRAAEGAEENPPEASIVTIFRWLNFALVFGGAGYVIAKRAPAFFRQRADVVASAMTEAAAVKAGAERQLREAEHKLQNLDRELTDLRAASRREAAAEAERLRAATQAESTKIARAADAEIEAAGRAGRIELKALAVRLAVERAQGMIGQQMTPAARARLFQSFIARLARQGGGSGSVN